MDGSRIGNWRSDYLVKEWQYAEVSFFILKNLSFILSFSCIQIKVLHFYWTFLSFIWWQEDADREDSSASRRFYSSAARQQPLDVHVLRNTGRAISPAGEWVVLQHLLSTAPLWLHSLSWLAHQRTSECGLDAVDLPSPSQPHSHLLSTPLTCPYGIVSKEQTSVFCFTYSWPTQLFFL